MKRRGREMSRPFFLDKEAMPTMTAEIKSCAVPLRPNGNIDYDALELLWLRSRYKTLKEFAAGFGLEYRCLKKYEKIWEPYRRIIRGRSNRSVPKEDQVRLALLTLWWQVAFRLEDCFGDGERQAEELKKLSAICSVLKTAHAGLGQLLSLEERDEEGNLSIEGVSFDRL